MENSSELANLFKFSSEYYDFELTRVYYNYRHYDPETGRETKSLYNQASPGKYPIAEQGGVNLYNFVQNNPVNQIDLLGLSSVKVIYFYLGHSFEADARTAEMLAKYDEKRAKHRDDRNKTRYDRLEAKEKKYLQCKRIVIYHVQGILQIII